MTWRTPLIVLGVTVSLALGVAGCGSSTPAAPKASSRGQALPGAAKGRFTNATFDQIPRFPRSTAFNAASDTGGIVIQSFSTTDTSPYGILRWYTEHLSGWNLVTSPHKTGSTDWRAQWSRDGHRLSISTSPDPSSRRSSAAVDQGNAQYNLMLYE